VQAVCALLAIAMVHSDNRLASAITMGIFATGVAASVLLIASHDRPFTGDISVQPDPLLQVMPEAEAASREPVRSFMQIFDGKKFDFSRKVVDRNFHNALRQIVYYSNIENPAISPIGFFYFRFTFKMTSCGWVLAHFSFKDEANELFPKDFTER
jgi:hypothetical protein